MSMKRIVILLSVLAVLEACIPNDLPYPIVVPTVESVSAEGVDGVSVDADSRTVTLTLAEKTDICAVRITDAVASEGAKFNPAPTGVHDMSSPFKVTLTTYQDYEWTFCAVQPIERYFTVRGQVGTTGIDAANHRAIATVRNTMSLEDVTVTALKLGPRDITTYSKDISQMKDFTDYVSVNVTFHGRTQEWRLFVEQTETLVQMESVSPWTRVAWLSAKGLADEVNGFRYRERGVQQWTSVYDVATDGGNFTAMLEGLKPLTEYECIAFSGSDETDIWEFKTDAEMQLPNHGFETFSQAESSYYFSFFNPALQDETLGSKWWDSGNVGSTTVGSSYSICNPDQSDKMEGATSARLNSRYVVIKFAAGNIFSGEFAGLVGTQGGKVNFGRPFTLRPRALKLWLKYDCGNIDCIGTFPQDTPVKVGDKDRAQVWAALGDWDYRKFGGTQQCPVQVNTTDRSTFFKADSDAVVAYGSWVSDGSTDGWTEVEIPLVYNSVTRRPTHIIVSCASSMLGDYFTGSSQSTLWLDDVRLIY